MAMMERKRTMTMNWDGLGLDHHDDDDDFFDSNNRISAVVPFDLAGPASPNSSDDDEFDDPRMSFASVMSSTSSDGTPGRLSTVGTPLPLAEDYDMWMEAPGSIDERRRRLLQGLGLNSSKELLRLRTMALSKKYMEQPSTSSTMFQQQQQKKSSLSSSSQTSTPPLPPKKSESGDNQNHKDHDDHSPSPSPSPDTPLLLVRSRSDGDMDPFSMETKRRKEQLIGNVSKQRLTRTSSTLAPYTRLCNLNCNAGYYYSHNRNNSNDDSNVKSNHQRSISEGNGRNGHRRKTTTSNPQQQNGQLGAFFLIKNLDTGKEFIVKEFAEDGMWNRLSDLQTGKQLTMEEFEKSVGYSPVVKELMRRQNVHRNGGGAGLERKTSVNAYLSKSFRYSKRRGVSLLKNINKVANSVTGLGAHPHPPTHPEKEREIPPVPALEHKGGKGGNTNGNVNTSTPTTNSNNGSGGQNTEWVRVRTQGKNYKELTALRFCQEIHAHQGSIWTIKFSWDGRYLASAGEDKVIHIWEVQECEIASLRPVEESANASPSHPMICPSPERGDRPPLAPDLSTLEKRKKGKSASRRGSIMPDYVKLPETVFALSNEPVCSFEGHLDDVLDLSWSTTQLLLLSSSMDKTVRLWDLETKACLKLFAHNDYVTCIQFNPANDDYFISGSLDAKVRIWSVPGRRVVDWTDLHEMVTAACYTPDGQGAAVGSHKGNCRMYSITNGKLNQTSQFDIQNKKKAAPKKITGFEFMADNPSEVLVTSADSRIRIYEGSEVVQKFRGFRNTSSQIAASYSPDGKYVVCASEDSNVYVWKREDHRSGKSKTIINTRSYEYFQCKDVSAAIPWPGSLKFEPPTIQLHSKRNSKRITNTTPPASASGSPKNSKRHLPPLPNNKKSSNTTEKSDNNNINSNSSSSNNNDHNNNSNSSSSSNDVKNENNSSENNNENNVDVEKAPNSPESDPARITRSESCGGDSFNSAAGGSIRYGDSPSISSHTAASPSWAPGWSWFDGGSHGSENMQATAWGLVIVTAGLGGEIRAYQNFGIPLRVGRQANLFRDLT